jgi:hypothetical protein
MDLSLCCETSELIETSGLIETTDPIETQTTNETDLIIEETHIEQTVREETMNAINLEIIKTKIELLNKTQHIEVLKIMKKYQSIKINENKSGIYINLSFLPSDAINELKLYIEYIYEQEHSLKQTETVKDDIKKSFFI